MVRVSVVIVSAVGVLELLPAWLQAQETDGKVDLGKLDPLVAAGLTACADDHKRRRKETPQRSQRRVEQRLREGERRYAPMNRMKIGLF
jgi:hypothetical protein